MRKFTVAQTSEDPEKSPSWYIDIDGCRERQYSTQWAAIVGAFVAAHETTHSGEEATIVMETSAKQVWTFSLLPSGMNSDGVLAEAANDMNGLLATNPGSFAPIGSGAEARRLQEVA
jgi:hypothetical protein